MSQPGSRGRPADVGRPRSGAIRTRRRLHADGAVTTGQRIALSAPAVAASEEGALELDRAYWSAVEDVLRGLVRVREREGRIDLRLLGRGPALLRLGARRVTIGPDRVTCRYPVEGGLLARAPAGSLTLEQRLGAVPELRSSVTGFHPRLAARPGLPRWTGALYPGVQERLHDAVGRRFLERFARGDAA